MQKLILFVKKFNQKSPNKIMNPTAKATTEIPIVM